MLLALFRLRGYQKNSKNSCSRSQISQVGAPLLNKSISIHAFLRSPEAERMLLANNYTELVQVVLGEGMETRGFTGEKRSVTSRDDRTRGRGFTRSRRWLMATFVSSSGVSNK